MMEVSHSESPRAWHVTESLGLRAAKLVYDLLRCLGAPNQWLRTITVRDVSSDAEFRALGIDCLWFVKAATCTCPIAIAIKGDAQLGSPQFLFEAPEDLSLVDRGDAPCGPLLGSTAEWFFYAFLPEIRGRNDGAALENAVEGAIYCLPLYDTREWFLQHQSAFVLGAADVRRSPAGIAQYAVPIASVIENVPGVRSFVKVDGRWSPQSTIAVL